MVVHQAKVATTACSNLNVVAALGLQDHVNARGKLKAGSAVGSLNSPLKDCCRPAAGCPRPAGPLLRGGNT